MTGHRSRVAFVPLAGNQTAFYLGVARALRTRGIESSFLSFHEPSLPEVRRAGFDVASVFAHHPSGGSGPLADALAVIARFGVADVDLAISHERAAYEIDDREVLIRKFASHLAAVDGLLATMSTGGTDLQVVQELGGFLSVAAVYYAARCRGIPHTFIEPSFFRGRVFLTRNSYRAPRLLAPEREITAEVRRCLKETIHDKRIAIPIKDAGHYRSAGRKIISARNVRRLVEKTVQKHVLGQREEFQHAGGHVARHLRMLVTTQRLRKFYRERPARPFVYYPFHVPADVALTIRAPKLVDQIALVDSLAGAIPATHLLAVKEHPALIGGVPYDRLAELVRRRGNVVLLNPGINNYDVLSTSDLIVTVNSKSGAEGVLLGRRVVVLGDAFYREPGLTHVADGLSGLPETIRQALDEPGPSPADVERFFQRVWDSSWPGELYLAEDENCMCFADSLAAALGLLAPAAPAPVS